MGCTTAAYSVIREAWHKTQGTGYRGDGGRLSPWLQKTAMMTNCFYSDATKATAAVQGLLLSMKTAQVDTELSDSCIYSIASFCFHALPRDRTQSLGL